VIFVPLWRIDLSRMMINHDIEQSLNVICHLHGALDALVVRGVRGVGVEQLRELWALAAEMDRTGASHIGAVLSTLADQIECGEKAASNTLMTAMSHARVLERLLTLRATSAAYAFAEQAAAAVAGGVA
jgi:hypothetical protein